MLSNVCKDGPKSYTRRPIKEISGEVPIKFRLNPPLMKI